MEVNGTESLIWREHI